MKRLTIDIETTGLPQKVNGKEADYKTQFMDFPYIVSLAFKINGEVVKEFIINQEGRKIPPEATALHGITDEMCEASEDHLPEILGMLAIDARDSQIVVGHGIYFDTSIIKANILRLIEEKRLSQEFYLTIEDLLHKDKRVDTMRKTAKFCGLPGNKWPKLLELYAKCFPGETFNAHSAGADVDACDRCYVYLKEKGIL